MYMNMYVHQLSKLMTHVWSHVGVLEYPQVKSTSQLFRLKYFSLLILFTYTYDNTVCKEDRICKQTTPMAYTYTCSSAIDCREII